MRSHQLATPLQPPRWRSWSRSSPTTRSLAKLGCLLAVLAAWLARADYADIVRQFEQIRSQSVWPVQGSTLDDIEETFGPRRQPSAGGAYDWHRGIDIDGGHGTNILAAFPGEFQKYVYFASGGWTLVLKHKFPKSVTHMGKSFDTFYTWYLHLNDDFTPAWVKDAQSAGTHPTVTAGMPIAIMGTSGQGPGEAYALHLHFEVRVATQNSLEAQIANYATNSPSYYGFDPHMHPLLLFPPVRHRWSVNSVQAPSDTLDGIYDIVSDNDDQPTLNRVEVACVDLATGLDVAYHALDLNQRIGFDASTNPLLDARDLTKPYFQPDWFIDQQTDYRTQVVIPKSFFTTHAAPGRAWRVIVRDIWGQAAEFPTPAVKVSTTSNGGDPASLQLSWPTIHGPLLFVERATNLNMAQPWSWTPTGTTPTINAAGEAVTEFQMVLPIERTPGTSGILRLREP